ncbi:MAG: site-specific recombinase DNA invertase Pin, partial [bacterium]
MGKKKIIFSEELEKKAVCYVRVSTEEQAAFGYSIEAQEEKIKAYCLLNNLEIVKIIREEGVSAGKDLSTRPGGAQLLELVKKKQVNNIVAIKLDRIFR